MELGSTSNYFLGNGEHAYSFEDLGSPYKFHLEGKSFILFDVVKFLRLLGSFDPTDQPHKM